MKRLAAVAACVLLLAGCKHDEKPSKATVIDQTVRQQVFLECLKSVPRGPGKLTASANDWNEVVNSCANIAEEIASTGTDFYGNTLKRDDRPGAPAGHDRCEPGTETPPVKIGDTTFPGECVPLRDGGER